MYNKNVADEAILRYLDAKKVSKPIRNGVYSFFVAERLIFDNSNQIASYSSPLEYSAKIKELKYK